MLGLGLGISEVAVRGRSGPALDYTPVLIIFGDSQPWGQTASGEQAIAKARWTAPSSKHLVLRADNTCVPYDPNNVLGNGAISGMENIGTNSSNVGIELKLFERALTDRPNDRMAVFKLGKPGATLGKPSSLGSITATVSNGAGGSGNILSYTGTLNNSELVTGAGLPLGYGTLARDGSSKFLVPQGGSTPALNVNLASQSFTRHNMFDSWLASEGILWNGNFNGTPAGFLSRILAGLAWMTAQGMNPKVVAVIQWTGTNDMANAVFYNAYNANLPAMRSELFTKLPLTSAKHLIVQVPAGGAGPNAVRTANANLLSANPSTTALIEVDGKGYVRHDTTHYTMASYDGISSESYDQIVF